MFKKLALSVAMTAGFMTSAFAAFTNAGFESGTTGWNGSNLTSVTTANVPWMDNPADPDVVSTVTPQDGARFGLLTPPGSDGNTATTLSNTYQVWNFGAAVTSATDILWLRLITSDWGLYAQPCAVGGPTDACGYNDSVQVTFQGTAFADSIEAQFMASGDSGWKGFAVPLGATGMIINVVDYYGQSGPGTINTPTVAIDYSVSAIPEPSAIAMMLAGLGFVGFKSRRRQGAKAAAAATC